MSKQSEIREELKKRYRLTFCFLCSLQGWHTTDMVPDGIMKEAEKCDDTFVDGWLEYLHENDVVIKVEEVFNPEDCDWTSEEYGGNSCRRAHYVPVVPLIEVGKPKPTEQELKERRKALELARSVRPKLDIRPLTTSTMIRQLREGIE